MITHDLSQIRPTDFVYVMKDGMVVEQAFRHDLMKLGGTFAEMAKEQSAAPFPVKLDFSWRDAEDYDDALLSTEEEEPDLDALARLHTTTFRMTMRPPSAVPAKRHTIVRDSIHVRPRSTSFGNPRHRLTMGGSAQGPRKLTPPGLATRQWRASTQSLPHHGMFQQRHLSTASIPPNPVHADEKRMSMDVPLDKEKFDALTGPHRPRWMFWRKVKAGDEGDLKVRGFFHLMWRFLPTIPHKSVLAFGTLASVGRGVATPVWSYFLAQLMGLLGTGSNHAVSIKSGILVGIVSFQAIVVFAQNASLASLGAIWTAKLRGESYALVLKQDKAWFDEDENSPPRIVQGLIKDVDDMRHLVATILPRALVAVFMVGLGFTWAMVVGWQLTLVGLALLPIFAVIGAFSTITLSRAEVYNKARREAVSRLFFEVSWIVDQS